MEQAIIILIITCCVTHLCVRIFLRLKIFILNMSRFVMFLFAIVFAAKTFGQQVPLDVLFQNRYNEITLDADTSLFTGFRSINWLEVKPFLNSKKNDVIDSAFGLSTTSGSYAFKHLG